MSPTSPRRLAAALVFAILIGSTCAAQGLLVHTGPGQIRLPRPIPGPQPEVPPGSYKIESIEVDADLKDQVAKVQVTQTFVNTGSRQMEACFVFPLPYDGAIDSLTLLVDGKEFSAKLLPAEKARKLYEEIVSKNQDPALLEWLGTGLFRTSVFPLPAGAKRTVTLRYSQLCRKSAGLTDFVFPLATAKYTSAPLDKLRLRVAVSAAAPIKNVYSPSHAVNIERPSPEQAVVTIETKNEIPSADFRLFYDTGNESVAASVVSYRPDKNDEGYFLLLASPEIKAADEKPQAKTVVFVVDRSGSMSGEKIEQARGALKFVLNNLREDDLFNIVAYDSEITAFQPELQKFSDDTRTAALAFVEGLYAGGSTNIEGALQRSLGMLQDSSRPTYVIFLTDGLPTAGETGEAAIVAASEKANNVRARVFSFGVGYDVNSRLLDKLARANFGQSEYVRPDEDIEASVSRLYNRVGTPVLTDVDVKFDVEGASSESSTVSRVYPKGKFDLFAGDQTVIVGRYREAGKAKVKLAGTVGGKEQSFDFPAELVADSDDDTNSFVAKLWATRRVGELIDEIDLKGRNEELVKELVDLATKHGILTQYTSFLADENADPHAVAQNRRLAESSSEALEESEGRLGFNQRLAKGRYQSAPASGLRAGGGLGGAAAATPELQQAQVDKNAYFYDAASDRVHVANNIRQIGRKTFFQRENRWVDSDVTPEEEKNAQRIERYSREYFDLVAKHGKHASQYLGLDEPVVVKLDDQVYTW
ncbi:MAG: VIT domain-containing protein [Pirellulales bacterium]